MSEAFVPFLPKSSLNGHGKVEFQQLKPTSSVSTTPVASVASATPAAAPAPGHQHASPKVTMQREGERVTGIRVECSCGQVILLDCVY